MGGILVGPDCHGESRWAVTLPSAARPGDLVGPGCRGGSRAAVGSWAANGGGRVCGAAVGGSGWAAVASLLLVGDSFDFPHLGLGIVIGHITSSISTSRPVGLSQHRTTSCRRTVSHCPATPPAAVELSLTALQHHQLPCRRTVSHCPATPPAAVELSLTALQHHQLPCRRTVSHCPATPPALLEIRFFKYLWLNGEAVPLQTGCCTFCQQRQPVSDWATGVLGKNPVGPVGLYPISAGPPLIHWSPSPNALQNCLPHCPATPPAAVELPASLPCNTTSCRRTVSHCPATPPAAVELPASLPCNTTSCRRTACLTALQHHQLPCRRTVSHCPATPPAANCLPHCPATPPAAVELSASLPCNTTSCRRTVSHCPATPPAANCLSLPCNTTSCRRTVSHCPATPPAAVELCLTALQHHQLPCRRTVSHCPATPPAAVELPASLPCNTTRAFGNSAPLSSRHLLLPPDSSSIFILFNCGCLVLCLMPLS
uniref:Uncharacterized protein n=1 Tax=Xenopus tropicalis TaxID=8364 RepID=A0A1B8Y2L0_XENTR